jgi:CheY-like chemotaxis protein
MPKKILIIDDDPEITSYLEQVFRDAGYITSTAANGAEALDQFDAFAPDLLTLDIEMPGLSGPKFNRILSKRGRGGAPIVVITGYLGLKYVIPNAVAEFDKPIDRAALLAKVKDILGPAPLAPAQPASCNPIQNKETAMPKKIMVVDDDPQIVEFVTTVLGDQGYLTCFANNAKQALEVLERERPDLMTLDLEMPGEWGVQFYRKATRNPEFAEIPVIVVSGLPGRHLALHKAVASLAKPFEPKELLQHVEHAIGKA